MCVTPSTLGSNPVIFSTSPPSFWLDPVLSVAVSGLLPGVLSFSLSLLITDVVVSECFPWLSSSSCSYYSFMLSIYSYLVAISSSYRCSLFTPAV